MTATTRAFAGEWSRNEAARRRTLAAMSEALAAAADELGRLVCLEQGKPLAQATGEERGSARLLKRYADEPIPRAVLRETQKISVTVVRGPLGGAAAITPWTSPVATLVAKIGPAFVAGTTVVAKPSPFTPLSSLALGAVLRPVVPRGTLNVIGGSDEVGARMTAHPGVRKISFTGSVPTGKKIMRAAAEDLKRVTLELGGNDPAIVLPDVDPAQVAPRLFWGAFTNSGQICIAIKRLYVHERAYRPPVDPPAARARRGRVRGRPWPGTALGASQTRPPLAVRRGEEIAQRLECGTAWVNQHIDTGAFAPFGGMKWSGIGRENGRWGIEEFCELQVVSTRLA